MPTCLDDLCPLDLGLPSQFAEFRDVQRDLVEFALYGLDGSGGNGVGPTSARRFTAIGAPGGVGKALAAQAIGKMSGVKYVVLTATKALEDQVVNDGFDCVDIRGRANYTCIERNSLKPDVTWDCKEGDEERGCRHAYTGKCSYQAKVKEAQSTPHGVLTNYAYWASARALNANALCGTRPIQLLIADECHLCFENLARNLAVWVSNEDLHRFANDEVRAVVKQSHGQDWGKVGVDWVAALDTALLFVNVAMGKIAEKYEGGEVEARRDSREFRRLERLAGGLTRVARLGGDANWIWRHTHNGIAFDCIWPARYAERYLWSGVERVVLMSATLRPKALQLLGLRPTDYWFREWPRVFPAVNAPVYWLPTGKMGHKQPEEELLKSVAQLDRIADVWGPRYRGIVHTNSYRRAEWVQSHSKWGRYMLLNKSGEQMETAERFKQTNPPVILVSPSYTTGYDFKGPDARWQVINKLPFPDRSDPITKARSATDADYYNYCTAQTFQQACMRLQRSEDDWGVTFCTDDQIRNFRHYAADHMSRWFRVQDTDKVVGPERWER